ncbi:hypothetical protein NQ176_g7940 [Zarea fungicola]|uniref:Uncharacterized protein n=1 Tax=Zarea fungicola TaxID=93591 RepID=A0ACC1MVT5_9HYPO|nr:hypothetical protein NQ176_g7940 [Lecanicillium fungicola]
MAMDGLDDFEKQLAAEKADREKSERRKHRHRHRDDDNHRAEDDRRHRHEHREDDEHRHKRHGGHATGMKKEDQDTAIGIVNVTATATETEATDTGGEAPTLTNIEHVHRAAPKEKTPPKEPERVIHAREINRGLGQTASDTAEPEPKEREINYTIGDSGSGWRMTKLRGVYSLAEESGRPVEEIAIERFGSLQDFDDAREERQELDRAKSYGKGYTMKEKPTGDLNRDPQALK